MSGLGFNSIAGVVLASVLGVMVVGVVAEGVVESHYPKTPGFLPEVAEETGAAGPAAPAGPPDFGRLFADEAQLTQLVARGERVHNQCISCHTFEAGGRNGTGPNLHDAFGRPIGSHAGFTYSDAMAAAEGVWDYMHLNDFIRAPSAHTPGTKMTFAGIRNDTDRVALIAYLRSLSPNQLPLPAPLPEAAPPEAAAPAEAEAPPPA
jgi:cytochrome c